jgi:hypothetical protein
MLVCEGKGCAGATHKKLLPLNVGVVVVSSSTPAISWYSCVGEDRGETMSRMLWVGKGRVLSRKAKFRIKTSPSPSKLRLFSFQKM